MKKISMVCIFLIIGCSFHPNNKKEKISVLKENTISTNNSIQSTTQSNTHDTVKSETGSATYTTTASTSQSTTQTRTRNTTIK